MKECCKCGKEITGGAYIYYYTEDATSGDGPYCYQCFVKHGNSITLTPEGFYALHFQEEIDKMYTAVTVEAKSKEKDNA